MVQKIIPRGFRVLGRGEGTCEVEKPGGRCEEPAAIEVVYGDADLNTRFCWHCYRRQKDYRWPDLTELRREAGWQV
jgi:hypothetical protein